MTRLPRPKHAALPAAALLVAVALAGCTGGGYGGDPAVVSYNEGRTRYLDATCPLRAQPAFWTRVDDAGTARSTAARLLPLADAAVRELAGARKPYPVRIRTPMRQLLQVVRGNRAYFAAAERAGGQAALDALPAPQAQPEATLQAIEAVVLVSSADGSPNCTGHGVSASPSAG